LAYAVQKEVDIQLKRDASPIEFINIPDRPYNDLRYLIDISKAKIELDWEPEISFEEGNKLALSVNKFARSSSRCRVLIKTSSGS
jgi:dTDP-D-glucose 4,6-dehydratase